MTHEPPATACTVTVCRDCCCGSLDKHPTVDHAGQLTALRAAIGARHRVRTSECLDLCDSSNVVVVQPSRAARRRGARPVHLGEILTDDKVTAVANWIAAGGPGVWPMPATLRDHRVAPPGRSDTPADTAATG